MNLQQQQQQPPPWIYVTDFLKILQQPTAESTASRTTALRNHSRYAVSIYLSIVSRHHNDESPWNLCKHQLGIAAAHSKLNFAKHKFSGRSCAEY
jgi:hypothetical protein